MKRHIVVALALSAIFCLIVGGLASWYLWHLSETTPTAPIPDQANLIEHKKWSTNNTDWYSDKYIVATSPEEVKVFYENHGAECNPTFRRYLEVSQFQFSCTGYTSPKGVFHIEVGLDRIGTSTSTILVVEVAWGDN